jgi:hypothetical protein
MEPKLKENMVMFLHTISSFVQIVFVNDDHLALEPMDVSA